MRKGGRIVNISSQTGLLENFHPRLQARFLNPDLTLGELDALIDEYSVCCVNQLFLFLASLPLTGLP